MMDILISFSLGTMFGIALGVLVTIAIILQMERKRIIRCRNCKWWGKYGCAIRIVDDSDKPKGSDFCSFAERWQDEID